MEPTPWLGATEITEAGAATAAGPVAARSQTPPEQSWFMIAPLLRTAPPERAAGSAEKAPGSGPVARTAPPAGGGTAGSFTTTGPAMGCFAPFKTNGAPGPTAARGKPGAGEWD